MDNKILHAINNNAKSMESMLEKTLCEKSFYEFLRCSWSIVEPADLVPGWHMSMIADHLQAMYNRELNRVIFNIPPRCSKSLIISVLYPVWCWIANGRKDPIERFLTGSYSKTLSIRDAVKSRRLLSSEWFKGHWPHIDLEEDQNTKDFYQNTAGGYRLCMSSDSTLTGLGGDTILVDDPLNSHDANSDTIREDVNLWYQESLMSRFNDRKTGVLGIIMQRLHEMDLTGFVLTNYPKIYTLVRLPLRYEAEVPCVTPFGKDPRTEEGELLQPERMDEATVNTWEEEFGGKDSYATVGQLQQRPSPRGGGIIKENQLLPKTVFDDNKPIECAIRYWDLAGSIPKKKGGTKKGKTDPDWTVGTMYIRYKDGSICIDDVQRFRKTPGKRDEHIEDIAKSDVIWLKSKGLPKYKYNLAFPKDPAQAGVSQQAQLALQFSKYNLHFLTESGEKVNRLDVIAKKFEQGVVRVNKLGSWYETWKKEITTFPASRYKDQADSLSGAHCLAMEITVECDIDPEVYNDSAFDKENHFDYTEPTGLELGDDWMDEKSFSDDHGYLM